jgi:Flp pilus assembly protein TadG
MVHMSYVPLWSRGPESTRTYRSGGPTKLFQVLVRTHEIPRGGFAVRPRTRMPEECSRHRDERGAEMVEFAFVVVLLIMLLYGIVSYGLILSAQSTVTQAAADGARAGIVASTTPLAVAEQQAGDDVTWMGKGACYEPDAPVTGSPTAAIKCVALPEACPSNINNQCIKVTVSYSYASDPLFPILPGLNIITPSTISSTDVLQVSEPSS